MISIKINCKYRNKSVHYKRFNFSSVYFMFLECNDKAGIEWLPNSFCKKNLLPLKNEFFV